MKTYSITYDLGNPGRNYEAVSKAIKALANGYSRPTQSQWLINSDSSTTAIRDGIAEAMDAGDKLLVNEVGDLWASRGLDKSTNDWLTNYWRSSCRVA